MGHSNDNNVGFSDQIKNAERKSLKNGLACAVIGKGESVWSFTDSE